MENERIHTVRGFPYYGSPQIVEFLQGGEAIVLVDRRVAGIIKCVPTFEFPVECW